ncbi:MAG TPA: MoxR family ATPase [Dehalococcoidia bacterium]|nr:MoxR family ATPase [Dehalococcoidia bacterium]
MSVDISAINERAQQQSSFVRALKSEVAKVIVGQEELIDRLLIGLFCSGHILIEGVPGLAKTLAVKTLAEAIDATFVRLQFTPDLLPADLIGTTIFNTRQAEFSVRKGPIFANIVLADEVNRAPAKVQSALLEAMQERQVSIGGTTYPLPQPFMVLATQNPIEHEGTYPLPEAQLDRFMLKVLVNYPSQRDERQILERGLSGPPPAVHRIVRLSVIVEARAAIREVHLEDALKNYILQLILATREPAQHGLDGLSNLIAYGASPRATVYLAQAAQAHAFIEGRGYVIPDDVKRVAPDVLRHRVITTYEAEAEEVSPDALIEHILERVEVP